MSPFLNTAVWNPCLLITEKQFLSITIHVITCLIQRGLHSSSVVCLEPTARNQRPRFLFLLSSACWGRSETKTETVLAIVVLVPADCHSHYSWGLFCVGWWRWGGAEGSWWLRIREWEARFCHGTRGMRNDTVSPKRGASSGCYGLVKAVILICAPFFFAASLRSRDAKASWRE